jgi:hypothetical protein
MDRGTRLTIMDPQNGRCIVFFAQGRVPIIFYQKHEGGIDETPNQHMVLVHSASGLS